MAAASAAGPPFVILGHPAGRRIELFQRALAELGRPPARVVGYRDLLTDRVRLPEVVPPGAVVRIESPGRDFETERRLIAAGAAAVGAAGALTPEAAARLTFDKGRLRHGRLWYRGLCRLLDQVTAQLAACPPHRLMNHPDDIVAMFDKPRSHARLARHGVPVPPSLGPVASFDALRARMRATGYQRVFVKPRYGSSAAGVVAYRHHRGHHQATTTVEMVRQDGELRLYATRRIRTYTAPGEIAALIDALCREGVHVEAWLPKAGIEGRTFDLRVVVIDGVARHTVVRKSRTPMTNLHLLNERGDRDPVVARMGAARWAAAQRACEAAAACFPRSLYAGLDLLITPDFRRHAVLEINAFGDLIPGILHAGRDTYTTEILAL
jgi:hypothetical protein